MSPQCMQQKETKLPSMDGREEFFDFLIYFPPLLFHTKDYSRIRKKCNMNALFESMGLKKLMPNRIMQLTEWTTPNAVLLIAIGFRLLRQLILDQ
jgi:hypothetical protein